jgi:hypothetical protein
MPQGVYLVLDCHFDRLINITIANCSRKYPSHIQFNSGNLMAIESKVTYGRVKTKTKMVSLRCNSNKQGEIK